MTPHESWIITSMIMTSKSWIMTINESWLHQSPHDSFQQPNYVFDQSSLYINRSVIAESLGEIPKKGISSPKIDWITPKNKSKSVAQKIVFFWSLSLIKTCSWQMCFFTVKRILFKWLKASCLYAVLIY